MKRKKNRNRKYIDLNCCKCDKSILTFIYLEEVNIFEYLYYYLNSDAFSMLFSN